LTAYSKERTFRVEVPPEEIEDNPGKSLAKEMLAELHKRNHAEEK